MKRKLESKVDETPEIDLSKWEKVEPTGNRGYYAFRDFSMGERFFVIEKLSSGMRSYIGVLKSVNAMGTIRQVVFEIDEEFRKKGLMSMIDPYHSASLGRIKEAYRKIS